jgi:hypothetical protein
VESSGGDSSAQAREPETLAKDFKSPKLGFHQVVLAPLLGSRDFRLETGVSGQSIRPAQLGLSVKLCMPLELVQSLLVSWPKPLEVFTLRPKTLGPKILETPG